MRKIASKYTKKLIATKTGAPFFVKNFSESTKYRGAANNHKIKLSAIFDKTKKAYKITILGRDKKSGKPNWGVDLNNIPIPARYLPENVA